MKIIQFFFPFETIQTQIDILKVGDDADTKDNESEERDHFEMSYFNIITRYNKFIEHLNTKVFNNLQLLTQKR